MEVYAQCTLGSYNSYFNDISRFARKAKFHDDRPQRRLGDHVADFPAIGMSAATQESLSPQFAVISIDIKYNVWLQSWEFLQRGWTALPTEPRARRPFHPQHEHRLQESRRGLRRRRR
jgi:hypothetical protein